MKNDPIFQLSEAAFSIDFEHLSPAIVQFQKKRILDNLGGCLAGLNDSSCAEMRKLARQTGGCQDSSLIGFKEKFPMTTAGMLNSIAARSLDFCDAIPPGYHPGSTDIPTVLAVGEKMKSNGRDIITALVAGMDITQRINIGARAATAFYNGFDSNVLAPIGGSIIAARLLKLDNEQMRNAIGLAFNHGTGTFQAYKDKVLAVRLTQGDATRAGIESAIRSRAGMTGPRNVLSGESGFFNVYAQRTPDIQGMLFELGQSFLGEDYTIFKLYPSCGMTLALTDAALAINQQADFSADDIITGELHISMQMQDVCGQHYSPSQSSPEIDAMFSVQYVAANVLLRKGVTLEHFSHDFVLDNQALKFAQSLSIHPDDSFEICECLIVLTLKDGTTLKQSAKVGKGWPGNPASFKEIEEKFRFCVQYAIPSVSKQRIDQIIEMVKHLEELESLDPLFNLFPDFKHL